jgi:hypothetical protein
MAGFTVIKMQFGQSLFLKMAVFWDVAPCNLIEIDGRAYVGKFLPDYTGHHPRGVLLVVVAVGT